MSERSAARRNGVAPSVSMREEVLGNLRRALVETQIDVRAPLDDLAHELKAGQTARSRGRRGIADIAGIRLPYPGERVERRESRPQIVRIRRPRPPARSRARSGRSAPRAATGSCLWAPAGRGRSWDWPSIGRPFPPLQRRVHIDARLEQRAHHVDAPLAHGKEERRESGIERRVDVGAGFDERAHDGGVPFGCGPHQRGLSAPLTRVVLRAAHEERFHRLDASRSARPS